MSNSQLLTLINITMKKKNYFSKMKGIGRTCLLLAALTASSLVFADVTTGLKLQYIFDDASGSTVPDESGNALDGTLKGAASITTGYAGSAVSLMNVADYVQLPNGVTGDLTDFTIAAWVKVSALNTWGRVFDFGSGTNDYMFLCSSNGSIPRFAFKNNSGSTGATEQQINGITALPKNTWVHMAVTVAYVDGVGTGTLYINGVAVGTNNAITITPAMLDATTGAPTTQNYIGKSQWSDPTLSGLVDDFRIYGRALTGDDVLELKGTPPELIKQYNALNIAGDLTNVSANVILPTVMGTNGVTVKWASSNNAVVDTLGNVTVPSKYEAIVKLTATLSLKVDATTYTLQKFYTLTVPPLNPADEEIAKWDFISSNIAISNGVTTVKDEFANGFVGTVKNDASIKTIGAPTSTQYNVLDLGNGTGYFDMGTAIGDQIYTLTDYTMSAYFRISSDYTDLNTNGNFIWTFSNSVDSPTDQNGYIIGSLKNQSQNCTSGYYALGDQYIGKGTNAPKAAAAASAKNGWHHICYSQAGTVGTVFLDGVSVATGTMANPPSLTLPHTGFTGTPFNWLGRSCYPTDAYLKKTLIYGFSLYRTAFTAENIVNYFDVPTVISNLNNAYAEDSDYKSPSLANEVAALTLPDLSAVKADITLPSKGTLDTGIDIVWKSNHPELISSTGAVTRPDYYDFDVTLTATLSKNGQTATKTFPATIKVKDGTAFTNDLLVKYDFASANITNDSIVKDAAEKHFTGIIKNDAKIRTMGVTNKFNVLALGDSIGYFDMGTEIGKVIVHLKNYTFGAYYRVDADNTKLNDNGNFLFCFANSANSGTDANGYLFMGLKNQNTLISPRYWDSETSVSMQTKAPTGGWHHMAYTQSDTIGTLYIDGQVAASGTMKMLPTAALIKDGLLGTSFNCIGRSCYVGDDYLRKTLVSDFRLYGRALTSLEIGNTEMNAISTISDLDAAYSEGFNAVKSILDSPYKVTSTIGKIQIIGLSGNEKIALFDITGRQLQINTPKNIPAKAGVYIVKIDNYSTKVVVR
jgi:hypothetical protein